MDGPQAVRRRGDVRLELHVVEVAGLFFAARVDWSIPPGNGGERVAPRQMWALSTYDARHMVNAWYVWELPVGKGKRFLNQANRLTDALLGGWQLSGIWTQRVGGGEKRGQNGGQVAPRPQ